MSFIKKYGLRIKGKEQLLEFGAESEGNAETGIFVAYTLTENGGEGIWLVDTLDQAKRALRVKPKWYKATYYTPNPPAVKNVELEVVEVVLQIQPVELKK